MKEVRYGYLLTILSLVCGLLFLLSLMVGRNFIPLWQVGLTVLGDPQSVLGIILSEIRLPRALIALVAGASLGLCGAAMQGLLRNPLASPDLLGSAGGTALFAIIVLYFGWQSYFNALLPLAGMFGAFLATALVYLLAGRDASITTLILAGVAINALTAAVMALILNLAPSPYAMRELLLWTMGDITDRSMADFWLMLPFSLLGWGLLVGVGRQLDLLTLGELTASSMGVHPTRLRWRVFLATAFAVGAAVSTTGMIGFVGLVVPHVLRPWVGHQAGRLLWVSAFGGAIMLLAADIGVRLMPGNTPLQVGVLTALVGAPFFLHLILKSRKEYL